MIYLGCKHNHFLNGFTIIVHFLLYTPALFNFRQVKFVKVRQKASQNFFTTHFSSCCFSSNEIYCSHKLTTALTDGPLIIFLIQVKIDRILKSRSPSIIFSCVSRDFRLSSDNRRALHRFIVHRFLSVEFD